MKALVGFDWPEGRSKQVVYVSQDHHVHEFFVGMGGRWEHADLTTLAGAPPASSRFITGYAWPESSTKQVAYLSMDGHIHELWVQPEGRWQHADVSAITGAPPARLVTAGYSWSEGHSKQVVFIGDDDHIHELFVEAGKTWQRVDLTQQANAPTTPVVAIDGFAWSAGEAKQVAYVGDDRQIRELWFPKGGKWTYTDLSTVLLALPVGF